MMALVFGAGVGLGVWMLWRAVAPRPLPIAELLDRLDRPGRALTAPLVAPQPIGDRLEAAAGRLLGRAGLNPEPGTGFALTGRSPHRHAAHKLLGAIAGFVGITAAVAVGRVAGVELPAVLGLVLALLAAVAGFFLPDLTMRDEVARRRRAFRHALSAYLDLVNILLAGGAGIETALFAAADAGEGWAFARLRTALDLARTTGQSAWDSFADLGAQTGVSELSELAASAALAGSHGARIRASLTAKADSLRGHQVAETEAAAEAATERMTIPLAVLLLGFLILIGYPAIQAIATGTGA